MNTYSTRKMIVIISKSFSRPCGFLNTFFVSQAAVVSVFMGATAYSKRNNDISNLMICNGMGHHQDIHATYNDVCASLMKKGIIGFNKETEEYYEK